MLHRRAIASRDEDGHADPIVHVHHPDRLRWPRAAGGAVERRQHALVWNVFRTLDWLPPAFWLRHLHARLDSLESLGAACQIARVSLWRPIELPPAQRLIDAVSDPVAPDVLIETEYALWTLLASPDGGASWLDGRHGHRGAVQRVIEAGAWRAGRRAYHCGLIVSDASRAPSAAALVARYRRSRDSLALQSGARAGAMTNVCSIGLTDWPGLAGILDACARAAGLTGVERAAAGGALDWLAGAGIVAANRRHGGGRGPHR